MSNSVIDAVRAKYPVYKDVPDDELTIKIGEKYPQYLKAPDFQSAFIEARNPDSFQGQLKGGESLTPEEATDIASEANKAFPVAPTPGRTTSMPRTAREWAKFMLEGMLHPIRQAETAIEQTAIQTGLAKEGSQLLVRPSELIEKPIIGEIPQIPPQEGTAKQLGAGAVNAVTGLLNFLQTPEGVGSLMLGKVPPTARRAVLADWAGQMITTSPEEILGGAEAWKRGDKQEATRMVLSGTAGAVLGQTLLKHGFVEPAIKQSPITILPEEGKPVTPVQAIELKPIEQSAAAVGPATAEAAKEAKLETPTTGVQNAIDARKVEESLQPQRQQVDARGTPTGPSVSDQLQRAEEVQPLQGSERTQGVASGAQGEVRDQVTESGQGPGTPHASEVPESAGGEDVLGVRQETREKQAAAGLPVQAEPGIGTTPIAAIENGVKLLEQDPARADKAMAEFRSTGRFSSDDFDASRAKYDEVMRKARRTEELSGTDSAEYRAAREEAFKWSKLTKDMATEWHKKGMGQQGEFDVDFGNLIDLETEYHSQTGKEFTPEQKETAETKSSGVKKANEEEVVAKTKLFEHIKQSKDIAQSEKSALDAAYKTVRDWAATKAELENQKRVSDASRDKDVDEIRRKAEEKAKAVADKTVREAARAAAKQETKDRIAQAKREKEIADIKLKEEKKRVDAANKRIRENAIRLSRLSAKERELKADVPTYAWTKAREYIDQGMDNFDDIRHKIATDMGLPVEQVTAALAKDKRAKFLADEVWRKQQEARRLKQKAKQWLNDTTVPGYIRALQNIPRVLFSLKVGFHGTVALGTHAPTVAFQPTFWKSYVQDFAKMYRMVGTLTPKGQARAKAYYEVQVQDLMRRKNYMMARRSGLVNDPFVYEDYNSPDTTKYFGQMASMGNRGYTVLKILRQDMFDQMWDKLPRTTQIPEVAEAISDGINHATGVVKGRAPAGTNIMLFAPRLEASRVAWLAVDPLRAARTFIEWNNATKAEKMFAENQVKEKLWVAGTFMGLLALNQGFLSAIGSNQKVNGIPESMGGAGFDPFRSDFLKFKVAGMNVSYGNAMITMAKLPLSLWVGLENEGKLNKIKYEDENTATTLFKYARSQASPFMGLMLDLAFGRDYRQRPLPRAGFGTLEGKMNMPKRLKLEGTQPYSWPEFWSEQLAPIPFQEAIKEVWGTGLGMTKEQMTQTAKAMTTIVVMAGTGGRITEDYELPPEPVKPDIKK